MSEIYNSTIFNPVRVLNSDRVFLAIPINLAPNVLPAQITFYYKITYNSTGSFVVKTCVVTIESTIRAIPDNITASTTGAITYNVLSNDSYRGTCSSTGLVPASLSNVTLTPIMNALPQYSINNSGLVVPGSSINPGTYLLQYKLCDNLYPSICQTVNVNITVPSAKMSSISNNVFDLEKTIITPNPTTDFITIKFNEKIQSDYRIYVYDILGRLILEKDIVTDCIELNLDLSYYPAENYFLKICNNNGDTIHKTITKL